MPTMLEDIKNTSKTRAGTSKHFDVLEGSSREK